MLASVVVVVVMVVVVVVVISLVAMFCVIFSGQTFQWVYFRLFIHWEVVLLPQSNFKATQTSLGLTDQPTFQIPI